jgi:hypothetical protein
MKINKIKLAALPGLKDLYDQTHFKSHEKACGFDGTWKGVVVNFHKHEKDDWSPQDCAQFFDFTKHNWEDAIMYDDFWLDPNYENLDPTTIQLGMKYAGDEFHYILILYDKVTSDVVGWIMDID